MKPALLLLGALLLSVDARAATAREQWDQRARDTADRSSFAFAEIRGSGITGEDYEDRDFFVDRWGLGRTTAGGNWLGGTAVTAPGSVGAELDAWMVGSASLAAGWRDVLRVVGGEGGGQLTITGRASFEVSGTGPVATFAQSAFTDLAGGRRGAGMQGRAAEVESSRGYGAMSLTTDCGPHRGSVCQASIEGPRATVDFTMTLPFEYGVDVFLVLEVEQEGSAAPDRYASFVSGIPGLSITGITAPDGAVLQSASASLAFAGGSWQYVAAVPEPHPAALAATGLLMLAGWRRRDGRRRVRSAGKSADG